MTPEFFHDFPLTAALRLLPSPMDSPPARAMMLAICLQESRLQHRTQINGPARGYAQFELGGGIRGVLTHRVTRGPIQAVLEGLDYDPASDATACYQIIEHNDIVAAAFARLLLYTLPDLLPDSDDPATGWAQYLKAWRPGKPHPALWNAHWARAWAVVE